MAEVPNEPGGVEGAAALGDGAKERRRLAHVQPVHPLIVLHTCRRTPKSTPAQGAQLKEKRNVY